MRVTSLRFTIRHLMALVMIAGLLMGGGITAMRLRRVAAAFEARATAFSTNEKWYASRSRQYDAKAREADTVERELSHDLVGMKGMDRFECSVGVAVCRARLNEMKQKIARCVEKSNWNAMMSQKYHAAASRPWLTVAADPPEPE